MNQNFYDAVIIGGGVTGCAIARELARYDMRICLVEKEEDVCSGTSKANSAIVHAGYDAIPGTWKARLNVEGSKQMEKLSRELDFDYQKNGSMVLCFDEEDIPSLKALYQRGVENGVENLYIADGDEARTLEPNLSEAVVAALVVPTGGIVCPFGLTIALAENAYANGVEFKLCTKVQDIQRSPQGYTLQTSKGEITAAYVVNAAGIHAGVFHNMVSSRPIHITARKGEYCLLDKEAGNLVERTIFQLPGKLGKGVLVTPTVHGNLLVGPTAEDVEDMEDTSTSQAGLELVNQKAALSVKNIPFRQTITSFAGLRAHEDRDDFVIGEVEDAPGFFDAAGIESPGLSCAPAMGSCVADMVAAKAGAHKKQEYVSERTGMIRPETMSLEERAELIRRQPEYGTIICRCEGVSEGEIIDAVRRPLGAVSLDGIKRRVRAGMGRCQAGFCTPRTMEILSRETGIPMELICKSSTGSRMITGEEEEA